ncbi:hypothetical protein [Armatimonas sp.]|uniref:DUF6985 domain-containing protein n=1 Tax=Armatimonas sp. TaxID=1872638 RepID=UPI00286D1E36|nr:hypothetical protein [Armatimonas sp.]
MSAFLDQFQLDPEFDGHRLWSTDKPLLRNAVVAVAPYYPEYPKLKKPREASSDPSCPSARLPSTDVAVVMYSQSGNSYGSFQERAWDYILAHAPTIEIALRRKLFAWHLKRLAQFRDEDLPHVPEYQKYWTVIAQQVAVEEPAAVDQFFKLVGIGLTDSGLDDHGFSSFEFQTGWDRDHGLGIVMHRDKVLAAGGMTELIYGSEVAEGVKIVQAYDLDTDDFSLLHSLQNQLL